MVSTPHINEEGGEIMAEETGRDVEEGVAHDHGGASEEDHVPEFIGLVMVEPFKGGHVRPDEMSRHEPAEAQGTEIEKGGDGTPELEFLQRVFPIEEEVGWVFVRFLVLDVADEGGEEGGGEVYFGERG